MLEKFGFGKRETTPATPERQQLAEDKAKLGELDDFKKKVQSIPRSELSMEEYNSLMEQIRPEEERLRENILLLSDQLVNEAVTIARPKWKEARELYDRTTDRLKTFAALTTAAPALSFFVSGMLHAEALSNGNLENIEAYRDAGMTSLKMMIVAGATTLVLQGLNMLSKKLSNMETGAEYDENRGRFDKLEKPA